MTPELVRSLKKEMITHSSTLAWKTPRMEEPGRLQSMGSLRVDMTEKLHFQFSLSTFMHWKRKWQPTPVFLPEASQGQRSLVGCRLWGAQSRTRLKRLSSSSSEYFQNQGLEKEGKIQTERDTLGFPGREVFQTVAN